MPDRKKYIEVLSKTVKKVKEFNEDTTIKISLECVEDILELLKEQEAMNVDTFMQWCIDSHIMGDATVSGIKYWVGKFNEGR